MDVLLMSDRCRVKNRGLDSLRWVQQEYTRCLRRDTVKTELCFELHQQGLTADTTDRYNIHFSPNLRAGLFSGPNVRCLDI